MGAVAVKRDLLRWAIDRSGVDPAKLRKHFPRLSEWGRGEKGPTLRQLEAFARRTLTPLGYFFLPEPPEDRLPIPDLRTPKHAGISRPSPNLLETVETMILRQEWMSDFLLEGGAPRLDFVGSVSLSNPSKDAATRMRASLGLEPEWAREQATWTEALRFLQQSAEAAGILVVVNGCVGNNTRRKLDPEEFQGFALVHEFAPLVFVNGADFKSAQMFTLAHELAHVWLGGAGSGLSALEMLQPAANDIERFCNEVAAEFLVPEDSLRHVWSTAQALAEPFQDLARRFKVSTIVTARRAQAIGLITRHDFLDFYKAYERDERRRAQSRPSGGDFYANQNSRVGRRFAQAVVLAAREGRILYSDAYRLTGLSGSTFDKYAQTLGLGKSK